MDKSAIKRPGIGYKHSLIKSRTFLAVVIMLLLFLFSGVVAAFFSPVAGFPACPK